MHLTRVIVIAGLVFAGLAGAPAHAQVDPPGDQYGVPVGGGQQGQQQNQPPATQAANTPGNNNNNGRDDDDDTTNGGNDDGLGVAPDTAGNPTAASGPGSVVPLADSQGGKLPFTGFDLISLVLLACALLAAGLALSAVERRRRRRSA